MRAFAAIRSGKFFRNRLKSGRNIIRFCSGDFSILPASAGAFLTISIIWATVALGLGGGSVSAGIILIKSSRPRPASASDSAGAWMGLSSARDSYASDMVSVAQKCRRLALS